jgi:fructosamine-3-kinase
MPDFSEPLLFAIRAGSGITLAPGSVQGVTGGSINNCYSVADRAGRRYFLKLNEPDCEEMFAAEFEGLRELRAHSPVRAPEPIAHGADDGCAWLLMEHLELETGSTMAAAVLGAQLASQHRHSAHAFGWKTDNFIGSTLQINTWQKHWATFFGTYRLGFQLRLARENEGGPELADEGARLLERLPALLGDHAPAPALLHGDLWGGNWAMAGGEPVIFDPAVYYGDREADVAMTHLFGGYPQEFYVAYEAVWPLPPGSGRRRDIYNLYHVLNHLNLFGGGYRRQAIDLIDRLLETG